MAWSSNSATAATSARKKKMQRVDAIVELELNDPAIARDRKLLGLLRDAVREVTLRPNARIQRKRLPTLYTRYRGTPYPLKQRNGRSVPSWRQLSPWMKFQIASLCLLEQEHMSFRAHLHDEVQNRFKGDGSDALISYIRDRVSRCSRNAFGRVAFFWFVIEDRTASGISETRPHVHGEIQILPHEDLPKHRNGSPTMKYRRIMAAKGIDAAHFEYGREVTRSLLLEATGNASMSNQIVAGRDQRRNLWMRKPYFHFGNPDWISYAFKNAARDSRRLGKRRLAMSLELNREAQRLWRLIREGESAMDQWV